MDLRIITEKQKKSYNSVVTHIMQSWEWGEIRKSQGLTLLRYGIFENNRLKTAFQLTLHKIPFTSQVVGYLPKGPLPDKKLAEALRKIGKEHNCAFIKLEPHILENKALYSVDPSFVRSPKPLFTKYNFLLDLTKSEEELLKNMHSKMRYNIKVAERHGVKVEIGTDDKLFADYLDLYFETTKRQGYFGHDRAYHKSIWDALKKDGMATLAVAYYTPEGEKKPVPLNAWMLFIFRDRLYYPYGGSSEKFRNVMAANLTAWEAIKFGKSKKLKLFDLWGAINLDYATPDHPWYGFTQFKQRLGATLVEYIGTFDLVFNDALYWPFTIVDRTTKLKVFLLKLIGK